MPAATSARPSSSSSAARSRQRLGERAAQVRRRELGSALAARLARRRVERLDDPGVAGLARRGVSSVSATQGSPRLTLRRVETRGHTGAGRRRRGEQVDREHAGRRTARGEQLRGPAVGSSQLDGGYLLADRRADERMAEAQGAGVGQQIGGHELRGTLPRRVELEARERRRDREVAAVAEHRDGGGERTGVADRARRGAARRAGRCARRRRSRARPRSPRPGAARSRRSSASSSSTSSALPPVTRRQAATNSGAGSTPRRCAVSAATPSALKGAGPSTSVAVAASASRTARSSPTSAGRVATSSATGSSASRRPR